MGNIRRILLTGANGFLGSHLLDFLITKANYEVVPLIRENSNTSRINHLKHRYSSAILEKDNLEKVFREFEIDTIIHTATEYGKSSSYSDILKSNVIYPLNLLEAGMKFNLKYFINTDTFFSKKEFNYSYLNRYSRSKSIFNDILYNDFSDKVKIANMRLEHVFGERDSGDKFVPFIFKSLINNVPEVALTEGLQKRDFIYVKDVVKAFETVLMNMDNIDSYLEFEVGTGHSISVKDFINQVHKISKSKTRLIYGALPTREGEIEDSKANITLLTSLGWRPESHLKEAILNIILQRDF